MHSGERIIINADQSRQILVWLEYPLLQTVKSTCGPASVIWAVVSMSQEGGREERVKAHVERYESKKLKSNEGLACQRLHSGLCGLWSLARTALPVCGYKWEPLSLSNSPPCLVVWGINSCHHAQPPDDKHLVLIVRELWLCIRVKAGNLQLFLLDICIWWMVLAKETCSAFRPYILYWVDAYTENQTCALGVADAMLASAKLQERSCSFAAFFC